MSATDLQQLKQHIDLHELAERLGLDRPQSAGNYRSPHHADSSPSLSVYNDGRRWRDHSDPDAGGDAIDLVAYVNNCEPGEAIAWLRREYNMPAPKPKAINGSGAREMTIPEVIAYRASKLDPAPALEYLAGRGISQDVLEACVRRGVLGYNDWRSPKVAEGEPGHGGPAAAFICKALADGSVRCVDMRYLDTDISGRKTSCQGEKSFPWIPEPAFLPKAHTIYVVESPINALSVLSCGMPGTTAVAILGASNVRQIDWRMFAGARVIVAMDADEGDNKGRYAGPEAAWAIHEHLTAMNVPCQMVDQLRWYEEEWNDVNDVLQVQGPDGCRSMLREIEPWLIPGLPGKDNPVKSRIFLPAHDFAIYWRYRVTEDFTRYIERLAEDTQEGEGQTKWKDVCSFRIASVDRVNVADHNSVLSGEADSQPGHVYSVSVQRPGDNRSLERRVMPSERLHKIDQWEKFGSIFSPHQFRRMLSILERTTGMSERHAVNFVGLCWRNGRLHVNEGPDCYFSEPEKQCPYHSLIFPSGTRHQANEVVRAYAETFQAHAATRLLAWALGGHMKALLGFWPHMALQADKGAGKSTLIKRLERSIGMHMYASQQIKTDFRLLCSVSHTSHPVGWEELSVSAQKAIDAAVELLQQAYQSAHTSRGADLTPFLISAPVLLAGEDVPVKSLTGKLVRTDLTGRKGPMMREDLPKFPVRQWLEYLASLGRDQVRETRNRWELALMKRSRAREGDAGASRMVGNYAAVATAAGYLFDFAACREMLDAFADDLVAEMNSHMQETAHDREPWVWITEALIGEIEAGEFGYPWTIADVDGEDCLVVRHKHVMQHMQTQTRLRQMWDSLPVKSASVYLRQLERGGVIAKRDVEKTINRRRHQHMTALSLHELERWGLYISTVDAPDPVDLAGPGGQK